MSKIRCKNCGEIFDLPEIEPEVRVVTEPCKCGMTMEARIARYVVYGFVCLFLCLAACCWSAQYYTTRQVEAMKEKYEVKKYKPDVNKGDFNLPKEFNTPYRVVEKEEKSDAPAQEKAEGETGK